MNKIAKNSVVTVSYVVTDETDQIVGRTEPQLPIVALMGHGYLVKGLEEALMDRSKGDEFTIKLNDEDAFGKIHPELIQELDRSLFGDYPIEVGNAFEADTSAGPRIVVITKISDDKVVVDGNHPLAGKTLNFMVVVEDVREATEEEIAHGHAHRDGVCPSEQHTCCGGHGGHGCGCGGHGHHHHDEEEHECCGGHGHKHGEEHECCGGHGHHGEEHECCGGHGHKHGEEHECCGGHGHKHGEEHECCGGHGHHGEEHECCGGHGHHGEEHECCGGHGHKHGEEHECCGGHGHGKGHGHGGHGCGCGGHGHSQE